jgi:signal transduction histidine kinase
VARHLTDGGAREQVEKSQAIARELLQDVREAVSQIRAGTSLDLVAAARAFSGVIASPIIHVESPQTLSISDTALAQAALRSLQEIVTNAVRHSGARNLRLRIASAGDAIEIEGRDDGRGTDQLQYGNGLRGMRERIEQAGGRVSFQSSRGAGFAVLISLPLEETP